MNEISMSKESLITSGEFNSFLEGEGVGGRGRTLLLGWGQGQKALPEVAAMPEALDDDVEEAVVFTGLVAQAGPRRPLLAARRPGRATHRRLCLC